MPRMNTLDTFLDDTRVTFFDGLSELQEACRETPEPDVSGIVARVYDLQDTLEILRQNGIA